VELPKWIKDRPFLAGIFVFLFLASLVEPLWSLWSDNPLIPTIWAWFSSKEAPQMSLDWLPLIGLPVGLGFLFLIWYNTRTPKNIAEDEGKITFINELLEDARYHLSDHVVVLDRNAALLETGQPYIEFEFKVFNGSIFPITIGGQITGKIYFNNQPLRDSPELLAPSENSHWPRWYKGVVRIRQFLDRNLIESQIWPSNERATFDFNNLQIPIKPIHGLAVDLNISHHLQVGEVYYQYSKQQNGKSVSQ